MSGRTHGDDETESSSPTPLVNVRTMLITKTPALKYNYRPCQRLLLIGSTIIDDSFRNERVWSLGEEQLYTHYHACVSIIDADTKSDVDDSDDNDDTGTGIQWAYHRTSDITAISSRDPAYIMIVPPAATSAAAAGTAPPVWIIGN
jgi:hypothetical protein